MFWSKKTIVVFLTVFQKIFVVNNFYILKIIHSVYKVKNEVAKFALLKSCNFTPQNSKTYGENNRSVALLVPEILHFLHAN